MPASSSAARSACIRARPLPRTSMSAASRGIEIDGHRATFIVPVNAPGVTTLCRKIAVRDSNPFVAPLSSRYDELDGQMWLDDVFIPWERVFFARPIARAGRPLADLAPSLRLAVKGRVHPRPGARADPRDGPREARPDDRVPGRSDRRGADRAQLPDRLRARPAVHGEPAIACPTTPISRPAASRS